MKLKTTKLSQADINKLRQVGRVGNALYTTNESNVYVRIGQKADSYFFRSSARIGGVSGFVFNDGKRFQLSASNLKEAKEWANKFRRTLLQGRNPLDEFDKKAVASVRGKKQSTHLSEILKLYDKHRVKIEPYLGDEGDKSKQKERVNYLRCKNRILKLVEQSGLAEQRIDRIDSKAIYKILDPISSASTLQKARASLGKVLEWAKREGYCAKNEVAEAVKHVRSDKKKTLKRSRHFPSLDWEQIPWFYGALVKHQRCMSKFALQFAILTAARSQAIRTLRYCDLTVKKEGVDEYQIALIQPENNKAKEETAPRDILLSASALAVVEEARSLFELQFGRKAEMSDLVFPNRKGEPLSESALRQLILELHERRKAEDEIGWVDKEDKTRMITMHGFRSTFFCYGMEEQGFVASLEARNDGKVIVIDRLRDAIEQSLLHLYDPSNLQNAYARHRLMALRQLLMDSWGDFCKKGTP